MVPPAGVPAELGFNAAGVGIIMHIGGRLRTGGDYGLSADISDISQKHPIYGLELTLWGDPSDASHDEERGLCADEEAKQVFKETGVHEQLPGGKDRQAVSDTAVVLHGRTADNDDQHRLLAGTRSAEPGRNPQPERSALADRDLVLAAPDGLCRASTSARS